MSSSIEPLNQNFPSQQEISQIYSEAITFNRVHTGYGSIFGAVMEAVLAEAPDINKAMRGKAEETRQESELQSDIVTFTSDESMASIGLRLEPTGSFLAFGNEEVTASTLEPTIDSPKRFSEFLGTLTAEGVQDDESFIKLTDDVLQVLLVTT